MSSKTIHILHLSEHWLRWATLEKKGHRCEIKAMGTTKGQGTDVLDLWLADGNRAGESLRLYDSRPLVFNFAMTLPAKARHQLTDAAALRIQRELGLGPEAVYWTVRTAPSAQDSALLDVTVMVVRREAMASLILWRDKHSLESLWVSPDHAAIEALLGNGLVKAPAMVITGEAGESAPATVYNVEASRSILRRRVSGLEAVVAARQGSDGPPPLFFGGGDASTDLPPDSLGEFSTIHPEGNGWKAFDGDARFAALCRFDPVVLGGVIEHAGPRRPPEGLLESHQPQGNDLMKRIDRFKTRPLALGAIVLGLLAAGSIWGVAHHREASRGRVVSKAGEAMRAIRILDSQEAILRQVKADRSPILPIIEAIHKAAPGGVLLGTLAIGDSGLIRIDGTAKNADAPNQFFKALAEDGHLAKVHMPQVSNSTQGKGVRFQLTAQMKGRD